MPAGISSNHENMRKKLVSQSFFFALGEGVYIFLVALLMRSAADLVPKDPSVLGPVLFLMLFVFSAAVSGALILGKPVLLYMEGKRREALEFFGFTMGWLFVFMIVVLAIVALGNN